MSIPLVSGNISGQRYQITVSILRRRDRDLKPRTRSCQNA
jgi:hypothetical protein